MIDIQRKIEERDLAARMILQVHDELVFEVHTFQLEEVKSLVKSSMEV